MEKLGTSCINLPQTHDIIRLLRLIIDNFYSDVLIITETIFLVMKTLVTLEIIMRRTVSITSLLHHF